MAVNRRQKGNRGEKLVADLLSKWTGKKIARAETNNFIHERNAYNSKGDVICKDEGHFFPFCTEVKNYADINFEHLLYLPKPKILEFWQQCLNDAQRCKKCPVLFMRYNGLPKNFFFVVLPKNSYHIFAEHIKSPRTIEMPFYNFIILTSPQFLTVPYKQIRKLIRAFYKSN